MKNGQKENAKDKEEREKRERQTDRQTDRQTRAKGINKASGRGACKRLARIWSSNRKVTISPNANTAAAPRAKVANIPT